VHDEGLSLFTTDGDVVVATDHARGPWDPGACHGGPVSAMLVRAVEQIGDGGGPWQIARVTVELMRPVPVLAPLRVTAGIERPGRMVSLVTASLTSEDGTEVARARALRVRLAEVALPDAVTPEAPFAPAGVGVHSASSWSAEDTAFHKDAVELVYAHGRFDEPGPVKMWCRLVVAVVPGEEPTGAQRAMCTADFSNGVASELDAEQMLFINPDLTVHLLRPAEGEWIGSDARCHYGPVGAGMSDAALYDSRGRIGRACQSILLAPR
jgi:hypothetical protein